MCPVPVTVQGCGASSDVKAKQRGGTAGAAHTNGGGEAPNTSDAAAAQRAQPRAVHAQGNIGTEERDDESAPTAASLADQSDGTAAPALTAPGAANKVATPDSDAASLAANSTSASTSAPASTIPAGPSATLVKVGAAISTSTGVVGGMGAAASGALGALAIQNPDGSYTLRDSLGPADLRSPALRRVLGHTLFGLSKLLQVSQAGKVLCLVLQTCYDNYNCSARKPQWLGEFCLWLKLQEMELLSGREQFERRGFLDRVAQELRAIARRIDHIRTRSTVSSFVFAMADEESLQRSRVVIEKLKSQALQGMVTEVAEAGARLQADLSAIIDDLERRRNGSGSDAATDEAAAVAAEMLQASAREWNAQKQLMQLLTPLEYLADLEHKSALFCRGTRRTLIDSFDEFSRFKSPLSVGARGGLHHSDEHRERVFFLAAAPGCGKTTLAAHLASTRAHCIMAVHFCNHALAARNDPVKIVKSITYQLCARLPAFDKWFRAALDAPPSGGSGGSGGGTLRERLQKNKVGDVRQLFIDTLVRGLCAVNAQALAAIQAAGGDEAAAKGILPDCLTGGEESVVVVSKDGSGAALVSPPPRGGAQKLLILIDSLDESLSGGDDSLLRLVSDALLLTKLPAWVGFVATSRMEATVMRAMRHWECNKIDSQSSENARDLDLFLRQSLSLLVESHELEEAVSVVSQKSEGMFLYARCVLEMEPEYVSENGVRMSLEQIEALPHNLADFYRVTFERIRAAFAPPDEGAQTESTTTDDSFDQVVALLRVVLAALEPLTVAQLALIMGLDTQVVQRLLLPLRSILPLRARAGTAEGDSDGAAAAGTADTTSPSGADESTVRLFHKSVRDWLTDPLRKASDAEADFFVDTDAGHTAIQRACVQTLLERPESLDPKKASNNAEEFPLLRVGQVLSAAPSSLERYALRYAVVHSLHVGDVQALRALLCSLQFALLKIESNQAGDLLRDFDMAMRALQGSPGAKQHQNQATATAAPSLAKKATPELMDVFRAMHRFFQAEMRHLTHGFFSESQAALVFQYAASYPDDHPACRQANQPNLRAMWRTAVAVPQDGTGATGPAVDAAAAALMSVDHVEWLNRPVHLDTLLEAWTELGPAQLCLAYHPNPHMQLLAAGGTNGSLTLYNTQTREVERTWPHAHRGARCTAVAFMPDGDLLASAGSDGLVHAWSASQETDEPLATLPAPLDSATDASDTATKEEGSSTDAADTLHSAPPGPLTSLCFTSDAGSSFLIAGSADGHVYVYARKSLRLQTVLAPQADHAPGSDGAITCVAFSHDPHALEAGTTFSTGGRPSSALTTHHRHVVPMARGLIAASCADGSLRTWQLDLAKGEYGPATLLQPHDSALECVAFSRDNRWIVAGGRDGVLLLHDLSLSPTGPPLRLEGHTGAVLSVDFSNGRGGGSGGTTQLCSGSADETVRTWILTRNGQWECGSVFSGHHLPVSSVRYAPSASGRRIASASLDESIRVWDAHVQTGQVAAAEADGAGGRGVHKASSAAESKRSRCWNVTGVAFDPSTTNGDGDGARIVSVSEDRLMRSWDASQATVLDLAGPLPFVPHHLCLGRVRGGVGGDSAKMVAVRILASRGDKQVVLYAPGAQEPSAVAQVSAGVVCMALAPACDKVLVGCEDRTVHVLSVGDGGASLAASEADKSSQPLEAEVRCVGFTGVDGTNVCAVLANGSVATIGPDGAVHQSVRLACAPSNGTARNVAAALSPFGERVLVASADESGVVRVWSRLDGSVSGSLRTTAGGVLRLHWSDADTLLIATAHHSVLVWHWKSSRPALSLSGHDDTVTCLASDGHGRIVSGSLDNRIVVWHTGALPSQEKREAEPASAVGAGSSADGDATTPLRSFLFESERSAPTGTMHLYRCHAGAQRLRLASLLSSAP